MGVRNGKTQQWSSERSQASEKIELGCAVGIEEACDFAHQFLTLFREAQWPIEYDRVDRAILNKPVTGVVLHKRGVPAQNPTLWTVEVTPTLNILQGAFLAIGINAEVLPHNPATLEDGKIKIYIGGKPHKP